MAIITKPRRAGLPVFIGLCLLRLLTALSSFFSEKAPSANNTLYSVDSSIIISRLDTAWNIQYTFPEQAFAMLAESLEQSS